METEDNNTKFHLYQNLKPHGAAVRALATRGPYIITGSIDKTCKIYNKTEGKYNLENEVNIFSDYILSLAVKRSLDGFIVGCKDKNIYVLDLVGNPVNQLEGHSGAVNSLSESPHGILLSGSWDGTAIAWDLSTGNASYKLEGHAHAVAVLALENNINVTGSQDKNINIWEGSKKTKTITNAHSDIIRDFAEVSGFGFLSCSNDEMIKMWSLNGELINTFLGHEAFVFSVSVLPDGRFISGSDDRSLKIWKDDNCQQSISHPGTVWVARVDQDGDVVTACADGLARVISKNSNRIAPTDEIEEFERSSEMAASQGPEGLSEAELAKIPSVDSMSKVKGKKDGEIRLFKSGNTPEAYLWKQAEGKWEKIGDVVGNKTSQFYDGDRYFPAGEYDYVFDVDDESGIPKRLPFNADDNPLQAAEKFLAREGLQKGYLEQITSFIRKNTRHAPGGSKGAQAKKFQSKVFPYTQLIKYDTGNFEGLSKKIFEFNEALKDTPNLWLKEIEQTRLTRIISILKEVGNYHQYDITDYEIEVISTKLIKWPLDKLLPVLDLLRLFVLHHSSEKLFSGLDSGLQYLTLICQVLRSTQSDVYVTLCLKTLTNMFEQISSRNAVMKYNDMLIDALESQLVQKKEKDTVRAAVAAFIFNTSAVATGVNTNDTVIEKLFNFISSALSHENNQDNIFKYLVAYGNIFVQCPGSIQIAKSYGIKGVISSANVENPQAVECKNDLARFFE